MRVFRVYRALGGPGGSIYTTTIGPKRPSFLWFWGPNSKIAVNGPSWVVSGSTEAGSYRGRVSGFRALA